MDVFERNATCRAGVPFLCRSTDRPRRGRAKDGNDGIDKDKRQQQMRVRTATTTLTKIGGRRIDDNAYYNVLDTRMQLTNFAQSSFINFDFGQGKRDDQDDKDNDDDANTRRQRLRQR